MTWLLYPLTTLGALLVGMTVFEWAERSFRNRKPDSLRRVP